VPVADFSFVCVSASGGCKGVYPVETSSWATSMATMLGKFGVDFSCSRVDDRARGGFDDDFMSTHPWPVRVFSEE